MRDNLKDFYSHFEDLVDNITALSNERERELYIEYIKGFLAGAKLSNGIDNKIYSKMVKKINTKYRKQYINKITKKDIQFLLGGFCIEKIKFLTFKQTEIIEEKLSKNMSQVEISVSENGYFVCRYTMSGNISDYIDEIVGIINNALKYKDDIL